VSTVAKFVITDGDNKFDLFQQLSLIGMIGNDGLRIVKLFRVKGHLEGLHGDLSISEEFLQVTGIAAEDGSGESWIITGNYPTQAHANGFTARGGSFEGYYSTRRRTGHLNITFN
jgi:hypothetical protein